MRDVIYRTDEEDVQAVLLRLQQDLAFMTEVPDYRSCGLFEIEEGLRGRRGRIEAKLTPDRRVIMDGATATNFADVVRAYVHEKGAHVLRPELADPELDTASYTREEMKIERLTYGLLDALSCSADSRVRYAAGKGMEVQRQRFDALGMAVGMYPADIVSGTWNERYSAAPEENKECTLRGFG